LRKELKAEKMDTSKIHIMGDLARVLIMNSDTVEAMKLLKEGLELCKKQNYDYGYGHMYNSWGIYYNEMTRFEEAEKYYQLSYDYFKKSKKDTAPLGAATALGNLGLMAQYKGDIEKAIQLKLRALDIWQASKVSERHTAVGNIYANVAGLYSKEGQFEKAIYYDKKGIEVRHIFNKRDSDLATAYLFLIDDFTKNKQLDSAKKYMAIAQALVDEFKTPILYLRYFGSAAKIAFEEKLFEKSLGYSKQMLMYAKEVKKDMQEMNADLLIAKNYRALHQPQKAISYLKDVITISHKVKGSEQRKNAFWELAGTYHQLNNTTEAYHYLTQYTSLKDSLNEDENKLKLNEIDTKYQTAQKEKQILVLEKNEQTQKTLIYSLITGIFAVSLIGFLFFRNMSIRKKIAEKEVQQLQQERQLIATNSILKGQEEERTRVARDLHDGLGGLLSGIKLTLNNVRGNVILPESGAMAFSRALTQLDAAIDEMRRVAHSMMPEALVRFGLPEALQDFCDGINESGQLNVNLQTFGLETRLDSSVEVVLYRIIQELLNNVIKHARASEAYVQITHDENHLTITIEDNGKGFDTSQLANNKGAGMSNIETRVAYLNGKMDIQSKTNEGTSVLIEIPT
jgi:signal transduction histidine kinase